VLFDAAQKFSCWIGLREPNDLSAKWIGLRGYTPKGEDCKAKTADNPAHKFAGLVVDPKLCPAAFKTGTVATAVETWEEKFLVNGRLPGGYARAEGGPEIGLVRFNGLAIYADFDLMAICNSNVKGEFLPTTNADEEKLFAQVEPVLNRGFGAKLIQHGAEFMWEGGVGARELEYVLWFGPGQKFKRDVSSMPKGGH
jgi:hypothetical protein